MPDSEQKSKSTKEPEPKREPREPRALSSEYHKARKQLMLWAGILFIWELVGIDLEKAKEAGGNAGAILRAIRSPQAVPWVLLILVVYFLFKVIIEWYQCNAARRAVRVSRIDYASAWVVSLAALSLYFGQTLSRIQFANAVQGSSRFTSIMYGMMAGPVTWMIGVFLIETRLGQKRGKILITLEVCASTALIIVLIKMGTLTVGWFLLGLCIGALAIGGGYGFWRMGRIRTQPES